MPQFNQKKYFWVFNGPKNMLENTKLHEWAMAELSAIRHLRSAVGGLTPHAFPIVFHVFRFFEKYFLRVWPWITFVFSYKLFETYLKPD